MRVLVYKRTHNGDPDENGCFGAYDCMGAVRGRDFDAVIGVGGVGPEAQANGIAGKVNWIGIGPQKVPTKGKRGPEVMFDHFLDYGTRGPEFRGLAPALAERMYSNNVRYLLNGLATHELAETIKILDLAVGAPPSRGRDATKQRLQAGRRCEVDAEPVAVPARAGLRPFVTRRLSGCPCG
jgi:hypothetical protein